MTTRREFLTALGVSVALPSLARAESRATRALPAPVGIGMQLYMARNLMKADPERTIARIAELGFSEVEWWGNWDRTPQQLRAALDANGLRSPSWHIGAGSLQAANLPRTLDAASTMGQRTLIIASLGAADKSDIGSWKRAGEMLSRAGETAKAKGIRVGYHNHGGEGRRFDGQFAYDVLVGAADPAFVDFQLDAYWALNDGLEPIPLLRKHASRITSVHLKDASVGPPYRQVDLGQGIIDWRTFLATGVAARVASIFLDIDDPADVWATAGSARAYLRTLGY